VDYDDKVLRYSGEHCTHERTKDRVSYEIFIEEVSIKTSSCSRFDLAKEMHPSDHTY